MGQLIMKLFGIAVSGGKRIGQVVSAPVYIKGNSSDTCIYIDPNIPLDNTTYGTKDFGVYNTATDRVNAMSFTINDTSGIGGHRIFCTANDIVTAGTYYAIYRLASVSDATGTATVTDACGVLGGDNTTCCYNTSCHSRGVCNEDTGICACEDGWSGDYCENVDVTCVNGTLNATSGFCACDTGFIGAACNIPDCDDNGYWSDALGECVCKEGWSGVSCATCRTSPSSNSDLTFVCHKTGVVTKPYILLALSTANLNKLKGHYITPGTTDRLGDAYDCGCNLVVAVSASRHQSQAHGHGHKKGHNQVSNSKTEHTQSTHKSEHAQSTHKSPKKSHSRHQKQVSRALGENESLPEFVNSLLEALGAANAQNAAIVNGALIEYIEVRGLNQSNGGALVTFMFIVASVFSTILLFALIFDITPKSLKKRSTSSVSVKSQ
jgi:hypothetical protein